MTASTATANDFGRVAVLMGGWSAEREISLRSGRAVLAALQAAGINAEGVDADRQSVTGLAAAGFDRVFLILHGRGGEDGTVQGALELAGLPYTGSGVAASALAMDKVRSKQICAISGIRTAPWQVVETADAALAAANELGWPAIIKPVHEGSSIGVSRVHQNGIQEAFELAARYGQVMVEQFIDGTEVTAAVVHGRALPLVSMSTPRLFYDYEAKYFSDSTCYVCPAELPDETRQRVQRAAVAAFAAIGATGWARADFMLDKQGNEYFIELNTAPGMTDHSLVPMAAKAEGISFEQLCVDILSTTLPDAVAEAAPGTSAGTSTLGIVA